MDVQFALELASNVWEYIPLPSVASNADQYELIIKVHLPDFVAKFLGLNVQPGFQQVFIEPYERYERPEAPLVSEARHLIESGRISLCREGVGGTYFLKSPEDGTTVAIFKPSDEEPGAENNPKKIVQSPLLPPGGGSIREVAAYELDRGHFAGVPETHLLSKVHHNGFATDDEKCGSLQRFVKNDGESSSFGSSGWNVEDVHRIGSLDIRIFNMDRNGENLLIQKQEDGTSRLIPIDHTYCLPAVTHLDSCYFEWQYWPQAKKPFSQETKDYIASIDIKRDADLLRSLGFAEENILTMEVTTMLLKEAVAGGWTLYEIACLLSRNLPMTNPSRFEELISTCMNASKEHGIPFLEVYQQALKDLVLISKQN